MIVRRVSIPKDSLFLTALAFALSLHGAWNHSWPQMVAGSVMLVIYVGGIVAELLIALGSEETK